MPKVVPTHTYMAYRMEMLDNVFYMHTHVTHPLPRCEASMEYAIPYFADVSEGCCNICDEHDPLQQQFRDTHNVSIDFVVWM